MGKQYTVLTTDDCAFIESAKLFFTASCSTHEVNLSPKGYDTLKIRDNRTLIYLDYPGSGNRTARDLREGGKATLMWCAFEGAPNILRCFCEGELIEPGDFEFEACLSYFPGVDAKTIRRFIRFDVRAVESSCGMAVPLMRYEGERPVLRDWTEEMAEEGRLSDYIDKHDVPPEL
ncbi:MAG: pyridoxamine 5'-phosphate oxidase family protein [Campylobacterales bacterium]|jgi:hypothetical protein